MVFALSAHCLHSRDSFQVHLLPSSSAKTRRTRESRSRFDHVAEAKSQCGASLGRRGKQPYMHARPQQVTPDAESLTVIPVRRCADLVVLMRVMTMRCVLMLNAECRMLGTSCLYAERETDNALCSFQLLPIPMQMRERVRDIIVDQGNAKNRIVKRNIREPYLVCMPLS